MCKVAVLLIISLVAVDIKAASADLASISPNKL